MFGLSYELGQIGAGSQPDFLFLWARCDLERGLILVGPSLDRIVRLQVFLEKMLAAHSASARQIPSLVSYMSESMSRLLPHGRAHVYFSDT